MKLRTNVKCCGHKSKDGGSQRYGNADEPFLGRRVMCTTVNLLPECQVVVCSPMEVRLEGYPCDPVKHEVRELWHTREFRVIGTAITWTYSEVKQID